MTQYSAFRNLPMGSYGSTLLSKIFNGDITHAGAINPPNFIKDFQKAENGSASLKQMRGFKLGSNWVASGCSCVTCVHQT